jgi:hypothetical protein
MWIFAEKYNIKKDAPRLHLDAETYMKKRSGYPMLCEDLKNPEMPEMMVYVDFDMHFTEKKDVTQEELHEMEEYIKTKLAETIDNPPNLYQILVATRDPAFDEKKRWKFSYRFYFKGLYATRKEMEEAYKTWRPDLSDAPEIIYDYFSEDESLEFVDKSVYKGTAMLNCVGSHKTVKDKRILKPTTTGTSLLDYIVQNVDLENDRKAIFKGVKQVAKVAKKAAETTKQIQPSEPVAANPDLSFLNKHLKVNVAAWEMVKAEDSFKLIPQCQECLVNPTHIHKSKDHSCLFINKRSVIKNCFSCGEVKLPPATATQIIKQFNILVLNIQADDSEFLKLRNTLLDYTQEHKFKRSVDGYVWKPHNDLPYCYIRFKEPKAFLNEIFLDNDDFAKHPKNIDNLEKYIREFASSKFPYYEPNRMYLGFPNGVLKIDTCEFIPKDQVDESVCVRKYFDQPLLMDESKDGLSTTPLFDSVIQFQFPDHEEGGEHAGVYEFLLMCIGRVFFDVGEFDDWQFMPFLRGVPGAGKSLVLAVITAMHNEVGTINKGYEEKFGLSALYEKDVVILDDLPKNIKDILNQELFQTLISGGNVSIGIKGVTAITRPWLKPFIIAGNHSVNYDDKGNVTRRIVEFVWTKPVVEGDPTLKKRIIQNELPNLMLKCLQMYKNYRDLSADKLIWQIVPPYFLATRNELRADRNPLFRFLTESDRVSFELGEQTKISDVKHAFGEFMGKPITTKLDHGTFLQANAQWTVEKKKCCKSCKSPAGKGCCLMYKNADRTMIEFVQNFKLAESMKE